MKWKDSDDDAAAGVEREDIDFDGEKFTLKNGTENNETRPNPSKKSLSPILMIGGGLVVLAVLFLLFFPGSRETVPSSQLVSLESKIKQLESRVVNLERRVVQQAGAADQSSVLARLKEQLGRLEATIAGQMNMMAEDLEKLKQQAAARLPEKAPVSEESPVSAPGDEVRYHQVQAGENLFRIGLRYGLKVDQLLQLNNMEPGAVIQPGQKLRVSP